MAVLLIASFMNLIDVTIVNVALPNLQQAFGAANSQIEWVVAVYILVFALGLLPFGRLGDTYGRRRVFVTGVVVFSIGSALCGMAPSMPSLIGARVVQGVGGAMMIPQTLAIAQVIFPPHERAMAFSLFGLTAGLASVTGPVLGGLLIDADIMGLGWRPIFLVNLPVGAFAIAAAIRYIPAIAGTKSLGNDYGGIALAGLAILCLVYPLIEGRELGWPVWAFAMMAASLPVLAVFLAWERRQKAMGAPELLPFSLLANRNFLIGTAMSTLMFSGIPGFFMVLAIYLQNGFGLSPLHSGLTTLPFSVGVLIASAISGRLGLKWPRRRISAGALLLAASMIGLRYLVQGMGEEIVRWHFIAPLLAGGIGLGVAISPMFQTVLANVPPRDAGSGSGALQAIQQVGSAFGVALTGEIFFSKLVSGFAAGGKPHDVFGAAMMQALIYSTLAFVTVALIVRLLPKPPVSGPKVHVPVEA